MFSKGIFNEEIVANAPTFPEVWDKIEPIISNGMFVAHNAVFDIIVLKKCLVSYGIIWEKNIRYLCTVQMGRRIISGMSYKLNVLCKHYSIKLEHHKAISDN